MTKTTPLIAAIASAVLAFGPRAATPGARARGGSGGATQAGIASWKGVPFAAPPVGPLRWRMPQPVQHWSGTRDASSFASDCMQIVPRYEPAPAKAPSEDCLYANIWKPAGSKGKLPV